MQTKSKYFIGILAFLVISASFIGGAVADRLFVIKPLNYLIPRGDFRIGDQTINQKILQEESVVIDAAETVSNSVVTVAITKEQEIYDSLFIDPFGFFGQIQPSSRTETIERDIGTGFVIDEEGLVVTNKHVVSDVNAIYRVITNNDQEYEVQNIYRDPANDLAILKINANLTPVELGDSENLKVGQFVIAIGTALGEFRHTVTTGVISGLGRGIEASAGLGSFVEHLDNVIQTDAAINPGNSGGPLLNSAGQVIGVNAAVSTGGENIGFALPINIVKASVKNFNETGQFSRPFLGIRYRTIPKETAILNNLPEGAFVIELISGSPADTAGIEEGDIIMSIDNESISTNKDLAAIINQKQIGEVVSIEIWRDGETIVLEIGLKQQ
jgi:S1-C subfamily serine protease